MNRTIAAFMIAAMGIASQGGVLAQDRSAQARLNYEAVMSGARKITDLSTQELEDVNELDRRIRAQNPDTRTTSQRCVDSELKREGGSVTELQRRAIEMKCREAGD